MHGWSHAGLSAGFDGDDIFKRHSPPWKGRHDIPILPDHLCLRLKTLQDSWSVVAATIVIPRLGVRLLGGLLCGGAHHMVMRWPDSESSTSIGMFVYATLHWLKLQLQAQVTELLLVGFNCKTATTYSGLKEAQPNRAPRPWAHARAHHLLKSLLILSLFDA